MGATWTEVQLGSTGQYTCNSAAVSDDGSKMFVCCNLQSSGFKYAWLSGDGGTTWGTDPSVEIELDGCNSASLTADGSMAAFSSSKSGQAYVVKFDPVYPTTTVTTTATLTATTTATATTTLTTTATVTATTTVTATATTTLTTTATVTATTTVTATATTTLTDTMTATDTSTETVTAAMTVTDTSTATTTGTVTTAADTTDPTDETTTTMAPVPTVVEVSVELTVDDPTVITENEMLKDAMVDGFASAMGVDPSQVTVEFVEVNASRRLGTRRLSTTLIAIFKVTLPSAQAAEEKKAAIEQVSVTDTNTAISKAVADVGYTGTVEVTGKTAMVVTTTTTTTTTTTSGQWNDASDATSKLVTAAVLAVSLFAFF